MIDVKALFLGPKAENQDLYETLILNIVRDSCFLRKNFHPNDETIITEKIKLTDDYTETVALLKHHLQNVLAELKKGVPLYHPRYIGHMHGDLLISAITAYFGTMLYNPNNVVGESSPATTKMELDYINSLCKMVGYKPCDKIRGDYSWGHLCAGGTSANIESMWIARNIKYYPLSVKLASQLFPECKFVGDIFIENRFNKDVKSLSFLELFNLPVSEILNLKDEIYKLCRVNNIKESQVRQMIDTYSVTNQGVYGIHHLVEKHAENNEHVRLPKVYVAKSYHYSWAKALDVIGLGQAQLVRVEIDRDFRMDIESLTDKMNKSDSPTLAVIGILGSSKQGSIDAIDDIVKIRYQREQSNHSFLIHVDGAYGGYFPSVFTENVKSVHFAEDKDVLNYLKRENSLYKFNGQSTINEKWCKKIRAISQTDSITIDPHKMGYIPYPAGSVLYADTRMKDFISYEPSYLNKSSDEDDLYSAFIGQWTLEGSRPGAAAAACFLSSKVLPLNQQGHGLLVRNSMHAADIFWNTIETFNGDDKINKGFNVVSLYVPETNIISYVISYPKAIQKSCYLNRLNTLLYDHFSIKGSTIIPAQNFMVAKDSFEYIDIPKGNFFSRCGVDDSRIENQLEITILSSVFMNPLSIYLESDFYMNFWKEVVETGQKILADILLDILAEKYESERIQVLWVEDEIEYKSLRRQLLHDSAVGKCLDIRFVNNSDDAKNEALTKNWDIYILDLNLKTKHELNSTSFNQDDFDDIQPTIQFIQTILSESKEKIIIYSSYLHNKDIKENKINPLLKTVLGNDKCLEKRLIAKTGNYLFDKHQIVNAIFSISQK